MIGNGDGDGDLVMFLVIAGFVDSSNFCCGSYGYHGHHVDCGKRINGTVYGNSCSNPSRHISWDGIHFTEAANSWVANRILNGSFSHPPVSIEEACHDQS